MGTSKEELWRPKDERYLRRNWGWIPLWRIAENLGRSETAVCVKVKRMRIPAVGKWPEVHTQHELGPLLGVDGKTAWTMLNEGRLPSLKLWKRNRPCLAVDRSELKAWLTDPENWYLLDVEKIQDPELRQIIRRVRERWEDEWLSAKAAGKLLRVTWACVNKHIRLGTLPASKRGSWYIRRSDVEAFAQQHYGMAV